MTVSASLIGGGDPHGHSVSGSHGDGLITQIQSHLLATHLKKRLLI